MSPGQLLYRLYYQPVGRIRQSIRNGGPWAERETERHRQLMEAAAENVGPLPDYPGEPLTVHLMTGRRFWFQTVFCLHSFARAAAARLHVELYDDGSIDAACATRLRRLGPSVVIHSIDALRHRLDTLLPHSRFPCLQERWQHYPNIRKFIDVHVGGSGPKLVLDSDLLFFRRPTEILDWLKHPTTLLHAIDCQECYGYSRQLLDRLAGAKLPSRLNVGVCGHQSDRIDWDRIEAWISALHRAEGTNYYLEQALVAMIAATTPHVALPFADYITLPSRAEVEHPRAIMHHYVDTSKRWYYRFGWPHFAPQTSTP